MKVYVAKLYIFNYVSESQVQPKIVGVAKNIETAKKIIYRELILKINIFIIAWLRYGAMDADEYEFIYPELSMIKDFRERADRYIDEIDDTIDIEGMNNEFVEDLIELENIEDIATYAGSYRYQIEECELL